MYYAEKRTFNPSSKQRLNMTQELQHRGGVSLNESPQQAAQTVYAYRPAFDVAFGLENYNAGSTQEAYARASSELALRRMLLGPFIYRSHAYLRNFLMGRLLQAEDTRGRERFDDSDALRYYSEFEALDRQFTGHGDRGHLVRVASEGMSIVAEVTLASFSKEERDDLSIAYKMQTHRTKTEARRYLDAAYPYWKGLDGDVLAHPNNYKEYPFNLRQWLGRLNVSDNYAMSFTAALRATGAFITDRLTDLHSACYDAGMPEETWWPIAYSKVGLLAVESNRPANKHDEELKQPNHENPYIVTQEPNGLWSVHFSDKYKYLAKSYESPDFYGCRGAAELVLNEGTDQWYVGKLQPLITTLASDFTPDVDFTQASTAQLATAIVVATGEKLDCYLNVHAPKSSARPPSEVALMLADYRKKATV